PEALRIAARLAGCFCLAVLMLASMTDASAARARANRIDIQYVPPTNPAHRSIYDRLKQARALEYLQGLLGSLRLPQRLELILTGCEGMSNAMYGNDQVTVCYEYVDDILKNASDDNLPAGITKSDAIVGPLLDVFLHEAGHAVFDYLHTPIFGKE